MYWKDERYRCLQQFYSEPWDGFDGADMTLFITRTFGEPGVEPPEIDAPSVDDVVASLRREFAC